MYEAFNNMSSSLLYEFAEGGAKISPGGGGGRPPASPPAGAGAAQNPTGSTEQSDLVVLQPFIAVQVVDANSSHVEASSLFDLISHQ